MTTLRLILGDQLTASLASLRHTDKSRDVILLCEVWEEATYVKHHPKKIALLFSAMRHFAAELTAAGYRVDYVRLDDPANTGSFTGEVRRALERHGVTRIVCTFPGEYRVLQMMQAWPDVLGVPVEILPDDRFICAPQEFAAWAADRKQLRMEFFYRDMRRKTGLLMNGDTPEGGQWNYDADNRKPPGGGLLIPKPFACPPDAVTTEVLRLVAERFADHFGDLEPFTFAVTRADALRVLELFITERLPFFGDYQDAMLTGQPWMYHAHIGFYLNCGLLLPMDCAAAAEAAYRNGAVPLNAAEGFIRQIIGWREYVRGVYWLKMPDYAAENFLAADRRLPEFYWTGETDMNCLRQCVTETRRNAYAHHIQRLMVLGNFALLAGIHPDAVNEWYLMVYADAYEWVELPNVTGMVLFADGGVLASKPYAASGAYINRMSDYCRGCRYQVQEKTGGDACPFNYLYWDFLIRNAGRLGRNPRMAMIYRTLAKMPAGQRDAIAASAQAFLDRVASRC
jgi:deoxyribodipyrimidine photolyase-related protein